MGLKRAVHLFRGVGGHVQAEAMAILLGGEAVIEDLVDAEGSNAHSVVLDLDPPALRSLTINGKLSFSDDLDISLETEWIYVPGGELEIGTEAKPHTRNAAITLTDNVPGEDINTMGDRGIMLLRGTLNLHGDRENSWTKLARTAEAGSSDRSAQCQWLAGRRCNCPCVNGL